MATIEKRTADDGSLTYRVKVRLKGSPTQSASFTRLTDARKWGAATETAIRENRHFKTSEAKRHTLAELIERYSREWLPGKRDGGTQAGQLKWWAEQIGSYSLADITAPMIAEYRDKLASGDTVRGTRRTPATVVRYLAALSHCLTVGVREYGWLEDSPMRKVSKPREPRGRVRFLSDDERVRLLDACRASSNPCLYPVVVVALSAGMRKSEIMNLFWREPKEPPKDAWGVVHLDAGRIILHETKNGERRTVPLVSHAAECLRELAKVRRLDTDRLFPAANPANAIDLRKPWENALKVAGIHDFHFHDLRHSAASYLAMNGASLAEIAETLGHRTLAMVKRYAHLSESHTAGVVERMNARIFGGGT